MSTDISTMPAEAVRGFDASRLEALSAGEPELLKAARAAAFARYLELSMPSRRDEEWKRTDPEQFPFDRVEPLPLLTGSAVRQVQRS